jgi:hypothetical protein
MDEELNVLVPTKRLRNKVFDSISEIESRRRFGWVKDLSAGLVGVLDFRNPGFSTAFAALIAIGALALFINVYRAPIGVGEVAVNTAPAGPATMVDATVPIDSVPAQPSAVPETASADERSEDGASSYTVTNAVHRTPSNPGPRSGPANPVLNDGNLASPEPDIVSEGSYLQTIATLERTVQYGKETLRPSERVAFETDLAVVNDAIVKMRDEVKRNPDNDGAREILKASYQNKVELLSSVAQKTELMASLQE